MSNPDCGGEEYVKRRHIDAVSPVIDICSLCPNLRSRTVCAGHVGKWSQLVESAQRGCCFCALLVKGIAECVPDIKEDFSIEEMPIGYPPTLKLLVQSDSLSGNVMSTVVAFFAVESENIDGPRPWPRLGMASLLSGDTSSQLCFEKAKEWIKTCENTHPHCRKTAPSPLPKRIIQMTESDGLPHLRLYESQREFQPYVCLSHCWGNDQPMLMTTQKTLERFKSEIPWQLLSNTFRDALTATWKLEFRYLWIDSLCILQDSDEDWREESANMCDIYGGAFLTIFATWAQNGTYGLFNTAVRASRIERVVKITQNSFSVHVRRVTSDHHPGDHPEYKDEDWSRSFPLLTRGWVYQERFMSHRILHFAQEEISWECGQATRCECSDMPNDPIHFGIVPTKIGNTTGSYHSGLWPLLVNSYSQLKLSRKSDRLVALTGLATQVQGFHQGHYLAGLWEDDIIYHLSWRVEETQVKRCNVKVPIWSWASVNGEIHWDGQSDCIKTLATLVKVDFCTSEPIGFGLTSLTPESITLKARIAKATLIVVDGQYEIEVAGLELKHDYSDFGDALGFKADVNLNMRDGSQMTVHYLWLEEHLAADNTNYWNALILRKLPQKAQTYERLGLAQFFNLSRTVRYEEDGEQVLVTIQ